MSGREQKVAEAKEELKIAKMKKRSRRNTVCAVPVTVEDGWRPPVHPKTGAERERVLGFLSANILFKGLDAEEHGVIVDAVERRDFPAGHTILRQGDIGDYYYVVDDGKVEIFVDDVGKVQECGAGASFGELALMYDAPRAATVITVGHCKAWALDQVTFKKVMMDVMTKKRELHEGFINKVALFAGLDGATRRVLADSLSSVTFGAGVEIIAEGEAGDTFYMLESGSVQCTNGGKVVSRTLARGDYFGEIALLRDCERKATVTTLEPTKCQAVDRDTFNRLFGPLKEMLEHNLAEWDPLDGRDDAAAASESPGTRMRRFSVRRGSGEGKTSTKK